MIGALIGRFAPYVIGILGVAVLGASIAAWVQSARLEAEQERVARVQGERDSAVAAASKALEDAKRSADAERVLKKDLAKLRGQYEKLSAALRDVRDDGCLDRAHPDDVGRLFADGDPRAGGAADPGVPGAASGADVQR